MESVVIVTKEFVKGLIETLSFQVEPKRSTDTREEKTTHKTKQDYPEKTQIKIQRLRNKIK